MQIELGALSPSLKEQFDKAEVEYAGTIPLEILQRAVDAISFLQVRGCLSDSEVDTARKRVLKDIKVRMVNHD